MEKNPYFRNIKLKIFKNKRKEENKINFQR